MELVVGRGGEGTRVTLRSLETMTEFPVKPQAPLGSPAALPPLAHPVHLGDHWIGNNGPPASPLLPPGTHLVPSSHPPQGTQSGRKTEGNREQSRSGGPSHILSHLIIPITPCQGRGSRHRAERLVSRARRASFAQQALLHEAESA